MQSTGVPRPDKKSECTSEWYQYESSPPASYGRKQLWPGSHPPPGPPSNRATRRNKIMQLSGQCAQIVPRRIIHPAEGFTILTVRYHTIQVYRIECAVLNCVAYPDQNLFFEPKTRSVISPTNVIRLFPTSK